MHMAVFVNSIGMSSIERERVSRIIRKGLL